MPYVVTLDKSIFSFHPDNKTMYLTFKNKNHALQTREAIISYIRRHKTLPPTYPEARVALEMKDSSKWLELVDDIYVNYVEKEQMMDLCKLQHIGFLEAVGMKKPEIQGSLLVLSYSGGIYEPAGFDIDEMKSYLSALAASS